MTDTPLDPRKEERDAIDRIARTADGHALHRYLRRVLESVHDRPDSGALLTHTGCRILARDLMRLMAQGIEDSTSGRTAAAAPILSRDHHPAARRNVRGAGRRVNADTIVPGWNVAGDGVDDGAGKAS